MSKVYSKEEVGRRLRDIRHGMGMTQEKFAETLDISTQLYKKMESGENNISLNTLSKMKSKLNFSTDYLFFGEQDSVVELWDRMLALHSIDKEMLLFKLFCDIAVNNNQIELKELSEKYSEIFDMIKKSLADWNKERKEDAGSGK